ncbi:MAG: hypothetical protein COB98_09540 [Flavobacteriaceae bacterium]|nr:MAG: hypothetical protein COB98_09540 [Flavobacteriaceae bacterium]
MRLKTIIIISLLVVTINNYSQSRNLIIGNWVFKDAYNKEQIDEEGLEMLNSEVINKMSFNFKSNGKFDAYLMGEKVNGKWELTKNIKGINLNISEENLVVLIILKLTKTELALKLGLGEFLMERGKGTSRKLKSKKEKVILEKNPNKNIKINESELIAFEEVEEIPLTSECNKNMSKVELKECVNMSIRSHIVQKFNSNLAADLGLAPGKHKITTIFIIDIKGEIVNVNSNGSVRILNDEASRVLSILPNMKPGIKDGKEINVKYTNTITFSVE